MAYDKAVDSAVLDAGLTAIANAIREKGGTTDPIAFDAMAAAVEAIESGGGGDIVVETGSVTPAEDVVDVDITFVNENQYPDMFMWFLTPETTSTTQELSSELNVKSKELDSSYIYIVYANGYSNNTRKNYYPYITHTAQTKTRNFKLGKHSTGGDLATGVEHTWIAIWGATI